MTLSNLFFTCDIISHVFLLHLECSFCLISWILQSEEMPWILTVYALRFGSVSLQRQRNRRAVGSCVYTYVLTWEVTSMDLFETCTCMLRVVHRFTSETSLLHFFLSRISLITYCFWTWLYSWSSAEFEKVLNCLSGFSTTLIFLCQRLSQNVE